MAKPERSLFPIYPATNENLRAIVSGMSIEPGDSILSICAGGDQVFAMAEFGAKIVAIDDKKNQIDYAKKRADALKNGDIKTFLLEGYESMNDYMEKKLFKARSLYFNRRDLEVLRSNICNITFHEGDFFDIAEQQDNYNKLYLSNILGWMLKRDRKLNLEPVVEKLPNGGLVYVSSDVLDEQEMINIGLVRDKTQSRVCQLMEHEGKCKWDPIIYRKH